MARTARHATIVTRAVSLIVFFCRVVFAGRQVCRNVSFYLQNEIGVTHKTRYCRLSDM